MTALKSAGRALEEEEFEENPPVAHLSFDPDRRVALCGALILGIKAQGGSSRVVHAGASGSGCGRRSCVVAADDLLAFRRMGWPYTRTSATS